MNPLSMCAHGLTMRTHSWVCICIPQPRLGQKNLFLFINHFSHVVWFCFTMFMLIIFHVCLSIFAMLSLFDILSLCILFKCQLAMLIYFVLFVSPCMMCVISLSFGCCLLHFNFISFHFSFVGFCLFTFFFRKLFWINFLNFCILFYFFILMTICEVQFFIRPLTKNIHTSPKNYFGPSQIFPTYYPTWAHTNTSHTIIKIGPQNYIISIKAQTHLSCGQNPKSPNTLTKSIATWHF